MPALTTNQLGAQVKYVNEDGTLTPEFIRQWNRQKSVNGDVDSLVAALQAQITALLNTVVSGGSGLAGGGRLRDGPLTISMPDIVPALAPGPYGAAAFIPVVTVDTKGRITSISQVAASGGGGAWTLIGSYNFTAVPATIANFTGITATEILVVSRLLTAAATGFRIVRVSTNNGVSYFTASGDYVAVSAGVETATGAFGLHPTTSLAAMSGTLRISPNIANVPKLGQSIQNGTVSEWQRLFVADIVNPINAIQIATTGAGNITGGNVWVLGR